MRRGAPIGTVVVVASDRPHLPSLRGAVGWLGSAPLDAEALRGRVVLFDFWTLTCINWLRHMPYVRAWSRAYRDDGLIVIGVHTPEFSFERDTGLIRRAILARGIDFPVAVDSDYAVWDAFANRYWPALYFADAEGRIRDQHFGEGRYEESERVVQRLLGIERAPARVDAVGVEAPADWDALRTPETYLGAARGERRAEGNPPLNRWALSGAWRTEAERVVLDAAGGSVAFRFHARDAHLVLARGRGSEPIGFRVRLDGAAPGPSHGVDVDEDGRGVLDDGRLYQLVRQAGAVGERTLEVVFDAPGAEAYVFTFG